MSQEIWILSLLNDACSLGHLVKHWPTDVSVYDDGTWIPGGICQRTPAEESLWLGVKFNSNVLEWQWPVSDISTCQVWIPIQISPPGSLMCDVMHFDLAETWYHFLYNGDSNTLSLPGSGMRTLLQTIKREQHPIRDVSVTQGKCHHNSGSLA